MRLLGLCLLWLLGLTAPAAAATIAFVGATLIDGAGGPPVADSVVVVTDGRIVSAGPRAAVPVPNGAQRIDLTGKTIMPGLINAHAHMNFDEKSAIPPQTQLAEQLALYARYGVTSIFVLGDDGVENFKLRAEMRANPAFAAGKAQLFLSGAEIRNPPDAAAGRAIVDRNAAAGADIIKLRIEGPPEEPVRNPAVHGAMIEAAHARNLRVAVHLYSVAEARSFVAAGGDIIAHSIRDADVDDALIAAMKVRGVAYSPTLTRDLSVFVYETTPAFVSDPFFAKEASYRAPLAQLLTPERQARIRANPNTQTIKTALAQGKRNLKRLADAGIVIAFGTDSGAAAGRWQGYFEHLELEMMVEAGMTPMQTIVAATGDAARVMGIGADTGTLTAGKRADLLVLGADPLADIRNARRLEQVWIGGARAN